MAYTKAPTQDTYSTVRIPAAYDLNLRPNSSYITGGSTLQDAGMINLLPVKDGNEVQAFTREPIHAYQVTASNLVNRGCYVWEKSVGTTYYFSVNGTGVFTSTDAVTWTQVNTLSTSATTPVRFTEFINGTNTKSLVMVDGVEGYVFTSNAAGTKITDPDFPSPHIPFPVYLDGYLFLAKSGTGDVYNSNLEDPTAWTAGDFLSSELYPDDIQALVKINNYLLVIGTQGCEYMYDAANPTGSPLARYDGGSLPFGTQFPNSVASNKNQCVFIANDNSGENVIKVIEDFKSIDIKSNTIVPLLNNRLTAATNATNAAAVRGFFFRQFGQLFYGLAFQGDSTSPDIHNGTWCFGMDSQWWTELRAAADGTVPFPVYFTTMSTTGKIANFVSGHVGGSPFFGVMEEGAKSPFSNVATDVVNGVYSQAIYTEMRSPNVDFGTRNRKFMSRLGLGVTDSTSTTDTTVTINVSWTDDDYATFNTPVALKFSATTNFPFITRLGNFRQRAFKLTYAGTQFLRYRFMECDLNKGGQ